MNQQHKLTARQKAEEQQLETGQSETRQAAREFATPEELLRHDAMHTPVPPRIEERLQESVSREGLTPPAPGPKPWWRRIFGEPRS